MVVKGMVVNRVTMVEDPAPVPWWTPCVVMNLFHVAEPLVSENSVEAPVG